MRDGGEVGGDLRAHGIEQPQVVDGPERSLGEGDRGRDREGDAGRGIDQGEVDLGRCGEEKGGHGAGIRVELDGAATGLAPGARGRAAPGGEGVARGRLGGELHLGAGRGLQLAGPGAADSGGDADHRAAGRRRDADSQGVLGGASAAVIGAGPAILRGGAQAVAAAGIGEAGQPHRVVSRLAAALGCAARHRATAMAAAGHPRAAEGNAGVRCRGPVRWRGAVGPGAVGPGAVGREGAVRGGGIRRERRRHGRRSARPGKRRCSRRSTGQRVSSGSCARDASKRGGPYPIQCRRVRKPSSAC